MEKQTDYVGNFVYENSSLAFTLTDDGRLVFGSAQTPGSFDYEYYIKDHLGNNRVVVADLNSDGIPEVQQESHYYPFGMALEGMAYQNPLQNQENKYLYNGKELQDDLELDWYDYGARFYDAQIGRWHSIDPMIEKHPDYTGYAYVYNNPLIYIDPLGLDTVIVLDQAEAPEEDDAYTATIYVIQNGEIIGPYEGSSFPDDDDASTLNEGEYPYNNEYGHSGGSRQGLNIVDEDGNRNAPGTDADGNDDEMQFVNVHDSFDDRRRNSEGCITVPHGDPEGFFNNFDWSGTYNGHTGTTGNSTGTLILRLCSDRRRQRRIII